MCLFAELQNVFRGTVSTGAAKAISSDLGYSGFEIAGFFLGLLTLVKFGIWDFWKCLEILDVLGLRI